MARKVTFLGVRGAPDRWFGEIGRFNHVIIEFKKPGERPTPQQFKRHKELRDNFGLNVKWTDSYAGGCALLGIPE